MLYVLCVVCNVSNLFYFYSFLDFYDIFEKYILKACDMLKISILKFVQLIYVFNAIMQCFRLTAFLCMQF